ncbi:MAG TPA: hypothetical protein VGQ12_11200 [Candidatus Angelobacter sp.]|jgi:hypothetical protein|nr:hypothetical protein [Candidatus Angelobacter sp.]
MKAVAIYDFRLSERAFWRLSLTEFWLLWKRHIVAFKRMCYVGGIAGASAFNARRTEHSQHIFEPMDFVHRPAEETQHDEIVLMLREQLMDLKPEHHAWARKTMAENLTAKGLDAEEILLEVFEGLG